MHKVLCAIFISAFSVTACDAKKTVTTTAPAPQDDQSKKKEEEKKEEEKKKEDVPVTPARKAIKLGEANGADYPAFSKLKPVDGKFHFEGAFTFELAKETKLKITKDFSNGNCGKEDYAIWMITKEDGTDMGNVMIASEKEYNGLPTETFEAALPAGKYNLDQLVVMPVDCQDYMYDFKLSEVAE